MHIVSVVGARPQFIKLAPVVKAMPEGVQHDIVHTGQHYDPKMSGSFFSELTLPKPSYDLGVGSGPHGKQTAAMLVGIEEVLMREKPDWVLIVGDTNSTLAGAVAATKLRVPLAHLEAGLRSFNRAMPEEHNRVLSDHACDLALAPSATAMHNLDREGLAERSVLVGDVMIDVLFEVRSRIGEQPSGPWVSDVADGQFLLATIHRAENTDDPNRLRSLLVSLSALDLPVLLPVHPRLRDRCLAAGIDLHQGALRPVEPLGYRDMISAVLASSGVVTDSGGLQKEAHALGVLCTTVRDETEWTETLEGGWNILCSEPDDLATAVARRRPTSERPSPYGDGDAAHRVLQELLDRTPS